MSEILDPIAEWLDNNGYKTISIGEQILISGSGLYIIEIEDGNLTIAVDDRDCCYGIGECPLADPKLFDRVLDVLRANRH